MDLFEEGNSEGRFPLMVLLRLWSTCFLVSSGRVTGCARVLYERPGMARGPPII